LNKYLLFVAIIGWMAATAQAEPTVIYDSGDTVSPGQYKAILQNKHIPDFGKLWANDKKNKMKKSQTDMTKPANWLPVKTNELTPGKVVSRQVRYNTLVSPVCIIGSDKKSLAWIRKYHDILYKNNALCWLVSANNVADVQRTITALDGIPMTPADGNAIAKFFSIQHYPVLITQKFMEQ